MVSLKRHALFPRVSGLLVALVLTWSLFAAPVWAASKIYVTPDTPVITFGDTGKLVTLTLTGLVAGTGQYSARYDRGAGSKPAEGRWHCTFTLNGAGTTGESIDVFLAQGDATYTDGQLGTTSAALASAKRNNLLQIGSVYVDSTSNPSVATGSGNFRAAEQYVWVGIWNGSSLNFTASTSAHHCSLTFFPFEIQ